MPARDFSGGFSSIKRIPRESQKLEYTDGVRLYLHVYILIPGRGEFLVNGTCGPCLIRHCDPNLSRPDVGEEKKRKRGRKRERRSLRKKEKKKRSGARIKRICTDFVSLANIFETAESNTPNHPRPTVKREVAV